MRRCGLSERQPWAFAMAAVYAFVDVLRILRTAVSVSRMVFETDNLAVWRSDSLTRYLLIIPAVLEDYFCIILSHSITRFLFAYEQTGVEVRVVFVN